VNRRANLTRFRRRFVAQAIDSYCRGEPCKLLKGMVARGGSIREANQDCEAARRVKIGRSRSESIERGSQLLATDTTKPLHGALCAS